MSDAGRLDATAIELYRLMLRFPDLDEGKLAGTSGVTLVELRDALDRLDSRGFLSSDGPAGRGPVSPDSALTRFSVDPWSHAKALVDEVHELSSLLPALAAEFQAGLQRSQRSMKFELVHGSVGARRKQHELPGLAQSDYCFLAKTQSEGRGPLHVRETGPIDDLLERGGPVRVILPASLNVPG